MTRKFSPNAILFNSQESYEWATGSLRAIAARDSRLSPKWIYGYALEFAATDPADRPTQFEDFVQLRLGDSE